MNMKTSVAVLAALLSACTASYSADTTADVGQIEDGSHVVVSVDHTRLVNGTTEVIANDNGTASISAILPPTYSVSLINQADGTTWNWNIVFLGYTQVGGEKTEIDLDEMIGTRGNLSGLTDIRVSIAQQETGAVVAQEQTISLRQYNEDSWQFQNDLVLEPAFSSWQTYFNSMGAPFRITYLETTGGDSPYNYTFVSQFGPLGGSSGMFLSGGGPSLKTIATVDQIPSVPTLATVATSGSYNDLLNRPTNVSLFINDANYVPASTATNIAKQIIRDAVSSVSTDVQTAEDARVSLTNLITILKNL